MPYIAFEGFECSGKTTLAGLLEVALRNQGRQVLRVHQPGTTPLGKAIREIVKNPAYTVLDKESIDLLMYADDLEMGEIASMMLAGFKEAIPVVFDDITAAE